MYVSCTVNYFKNSNRPVRLFDGQRLETNKIGLIQYESLKCLSNCRVINFFTAFDELDGTL